MTGDGGGGAKPSVLDIFDVKERLVAEAGFDPEPGVLPGSFFLGKKAMTMLTILYRLIECVDGELGLCLIPYKLATALKQWLLARIF